MSQGRAGAFIYLCVALVCVFLDPLFVVVPPYSRRSIPSYCHPIRSFSGRAGPLRRKQASSKYRVERISPCTASFVICVIDLKYGGPSQGGGLTACSA